MRGYRNIFSNIDWVVVGIYLLLVFFGWINIYAAVYNEEHFKIFDISQLYGKQMMWIGFALIIAFIILLVEGQFFTSFAFPIYIGVIFLLLGVLLFGEEVHGARSWFKIGDFALQPSEFAKFATGLALAKYLSALNIKMGDLKTKVIASIIIGIPALLILIQGDAGSTLVYIAFVFMMYREGLSGNILLFGLLAIVVFVLTLIYGSVHVIITASFAYLIFHTLIKYNLKTTIISVIVFSFFVYTYYHYDFNEKYAYYFIGISLSTLLLFLVFKKEMRDKAIHFVGILIFLLTCFHIFSIDFTFNNILKEHQRTRITVLLGEEDKLIEQIDELTLEMNEIKLNKEVKININNDLIEKKTHLKDLRQGDGWNIKQSLIAIGSGGFMGKGFLEGTQTKFNFVPEQSTDFIFCTIGEEWGFIGTFIVVCLYLGLFLRLLFLAERQRSIFTRIYGYSVASIMFFHFFVNIGMTIGLIPVIGIPLPFISYGGSSLWSFTILLFIFLKLDSERLLVLR